MMAIWADLCGKCIKWDKKSFTLSRNTRYFGADDSLRSSTPIKQVRNPGGCVKSVHNPVSMHKSLAFAAAAPTEIPSPHT